MIRFIELRAAVLLVLNVAVAGQAATPDADHGGLRLASELIARADVADFRISDNAGPTSTVAITFAEPARTRLDAAVANRTGGMVSLTIDGKYVWGAVFFRAVPLPSITANDVPDETAKALAQYLSH